MHAHNNLCLSFTWSRRGCQTAQLIEYIFLQQTSIAITHRSQFPWACKGRFSHINACVITAAVAHNTNAATCCIVERGMATHDMCIYVHVRVLICIQ